MRFGALGAAAIGYLWFVSGPASAGTPCPTDGIGIHSSKAQTLITFGVLHSGDPSVFVTVDNPQKTDASGWTVEGDTLPGTHGFRASAHGSRPDEARIDVSQIDQTAKVHFVNANGDACDPVSIELVSLRTPDDVIVIVLPLQGKQQQWPPVPAGTIQLSPTMSITNTYAAVTDNGLSLSGQLQVAGKLASRAAISFLVHTKPNPWIGASGKLVFDVSGPGGGTFSIGLTKLVCANVPVGACSYDAALELPALAALNAAKPAAPVLIGVQLGDDGVFRLTPTGAAAQFHWDSSDPSKYLQFTQLQIDAAKRTVSAAGELHTGGAKYTINDLSFRPPAGGSLTGLVPSGTIAFDQDKSLKLGPITITHLTGNASFQAGTQAQVTFSTTADVEFKLNGGTDVKVRLENLALSASGDPFADIAAQNISGWKPDFSKARVVPIVGQSTVFNHGLAECPADAKEPVAMPDPDAPKDMQFCVGVHLTPGTVVRPEDVAFAYAAFKPWDGQTRKLELKSLAFTVPKSRPAKLALAGARVDITALRVDMNDSQGGTYAGFDADVPVDMLTEMNCDRVDVAGEADITGLSIGTAQKQEVAVTPRLGFGKNCTVFSLRGALPLQLTPQSNLLLTSLVYLHTTTPVVPKAVATDPPAAVSQRFLTVTPVAVATPAPATGEFQAARDYLKASGSFTSGNVTVFFNGIGFRTFLPHAHPESDWNCDRKNRQEYELPGTRMCAIVNVNLPMTLAATGVQNASTIEKLVQQAASAVIGFLAAKVK